MLHEILRLACSSDQLSTEWILSLSIKKTVNWNTFFALRLEFIFHDAYELYSKLDLTKFRLFFITLWLSSLHHLYSEFIQSQSLIMSHHVMVTQTTCFSTLSLFSLKFVPLQSKHKKESTHCSTLAYLFDFNSYFVFLFSPVRFFSYHTAFPRSHCSGDRDRLREPERMGRRRSRSGGHPEGSRLIRRHYRFARHQLRSGSAGQHAARRQAA